MIRQVMLGTVCGLALCGGALAGNVKSDDVLTPDPAFIGMPDEVGLRATEKTLQECWGAALTGVTKATGGLPAGSVDVRAIVFLKRVGRRAFLDFRYLIDTKTNTCRHGTACGAKPPAAA
jgi:hypothetical protein